MKPFHAVAALTALLLTTSACSQPNSPPQGGEYVPPGYGGIRIVFEGHDNQDFAATIKVQITIFAVAKNPRLFGAFEDPDSGISYPFRDPSTGTNLPVILPEKRTPYGAPIYIPIGEEVSFNITAHFEDSWGSVVHCLFADLNRNEIPGTRQHYGIYDVPRDSFVVGSGNVACSYNAVG